MKVAIIILNWNGQSLLQKFLPSVINYSQDLADVYVADNASTDNSIEFISTEFPSVKIIKNSQNFGFANGYNVALKNVDADIFCLLNNDIEVTKNWLNPILQEFQTNNQTAIIQPKILNYNTKSDFDHAGAAGGFVDKYGYPYCRGRIFNTIEKDLGQYNQACDIFWASGACLFIKSESYWQLNGLDPHFFAHMEEIDLCWRAFSNNLKAKFIGNSVVYHVGGATLSESNPRKTYLNFRNSLFMLTKNLPKKSLALIIISRLILDGIAGIKFLIQLQPLHTLAVIKAHFGYYGHLRFLLKQRIDLTNQKKYYTKSSIVWSYYVLNKQTFNSL